MPNTEPMGTATVIVTILDVNDNSPQFSAPFISIIVEENITIAGEISTVSATDNDSGNNSILYYTIVNNTGLPFTISDDGILTTIALLDRETIETYNFMVLAVDGGEPTMTGSTSVTITLSDVNDNAPVFISHTISVSYEENLNIGSIVAVTMATDIDDGLNSRITYSITSGNDEMRFSINSQTGKILLERILDFETTEMFSLQITAQDGGTPSLSATANLLVNVSDVIENMHSPMFSESQFTVEFPEDTENNSVIFNATAIDDDSGINAIFLTAL